jgi:hypothetical protein
MTSDELRDYWDALVTGAPLPDAVDPDFAATIQEFHALDDTPAPEPSVMAGVWRDLVGESLVTAPLAPLQLKTYMANGRAMPAIDRYE